MTAPLAHSMPTSVSDLYDFIDKMLTTEQKETIATKTLKPKSLMTLADLLDKRQHFDIELWCMLEYIPASDENIVLGKFKDVYTYLLRSHSTEHSLYLLSKITDILLNQFPRSDLEDLLTTIEQTL